MPDNVALLTFLSVMHFENVQESCATKTAPPPPQKNPSNWLSTCLCCCCRSHWWSALCNVCEDPSFCTSWMAACRERNGLQVRKGSSEKWVASTTKSSYDLMCIKSCWLNKELMVLLFMFCVSQPSFHWWALIWCSPVWRDMQSSK